MFCASFSDFRISFDPTIESIREILVIDFVESSGIVGVGFF